MIRRSPAEVYLQYLILHPKKYTDAQITEICQFAQLDYLGNWYLSRLRANLTPPKPFHPFDRNHTRSANFLYLNQLHPIFHTDDAARRAFKILELPRLKEFVEASIISGAPEAAIAMMASRRFRFKDCTPQVIERYRSFFWNIHLLDATELRALLQLRWAQLLNHPDAEIKAQAVLMSKAYYQDSRKSAADLPFSPISAMLSQMKMGIMPSNLDVAVIITQAQKFAAIRTAEELMANGKGASNNALNFSIVAEKMTTVLKDIAKPDEELQKQLANIALRTSDDAIPTIHALTVGGGSFTTDTGPKENIHELPANVDDGDPGAGPPEAAR